jgi:hypothetical protein
MFEQLLLNKNKIIIVPNSNLALPNWDLNKAPQHDVPSFLLAGRMDWTPRWLVSSLSQILDTGEGSRRTAIFQSVAWVRAKVGRPDGDGPRRNSLFTEAWESSLSPVQQHRSKGFQDLGRLAKPSFGPVLSPLISFSIRLFYPHLASLFYTRKCWASVGTLALSWVATAQITHCILSSTTLFHKFVKKIY